MTSKTQLDHYVSDVLIPRVQELMQAAFDGKPAIELRGLFEQNIKSGLKFFWKQWIPVYTEQHGDKATLHAKDTVDHLLQEVKTASVNDIPHNIVKVLWYLLSLSLEDMDGVPVFSDELTFTHLEAAIKNATYRIN